MAYFVVDGPVRASVRTRELAPDPKGRPDHPPGRGKLRGWGCARGCPLTHRTTRRAAALHPGGPACFPLASVPAPWDGGAWPASETRRSHPLRRNPRLRWSTSWRSRIRDGCASGRAAPSRRWTPPTSGARRRPVRPSSSGSGPPSEANPVPDPRGDGRGGSGPGGRAVGRPPAHGGGRRSVDRGSCTALFSPPILGLSFGDGRRCLVRERAPSAETASPP